MKLNAVGVTSSAIFESVRYYRLLGFRFPRLREMEQHVESIPSEGSIKLMIDFKDVVAGIIGENPRPSNHAGFAVEYDKPTEVDGIVKMVQEAGYKVVKEPWDAVWRQRYAIVEDPDGYRVELYSAQPK